MIIMYVYQYRCGNIKKIILAIHKHIIRTMPSRQFILTHILCIYQGIYISAVLWEEER